MVWLMCQGTGQCYFFLITCIKIIDKLSYFIYSIWVIYMSSPTSIKAAQVLANQLEGLGIASKVCEVKGNPWLAKVETPLGPFAVYTNAKGRVNVMTHFIQNEAARDKACWALEKINAQATIDPIDAHTWIAYTDGSAQGGQCGWSSVLFDPSGKKDYEKCGNLGPQLNGQIAGEVEGAISAISDSISKKINKLVLRHDYEGIGNWGTGKWGNKDSDATRLKLWCKYAKEKGLKITFQWTKGHNGDAGNERADVLASKATSAKVQDRIKDPPKAITQSMATQLDFSL